MNNPTEEKELIRPHTYDGIQEYDKRLPNWWLMTLWGAIFFAVVYWIYYHQFHIGLEPNIAVEIQMMENRRSASLNASVLTDDSLWTLSRDSKIVEAGKTTFLTNCASCHLPTLTGQIGPNLVDEYWLHGGKPLEVSTTIEKGVLEKGMPTWGPVLGKQKITEVVAFIFSYHKPGESIKQAPPWVPGQVMQVPVAGN